MRGESYAFAGKMGRPADPQSRSAAGEGSATGGGPGGPDSASTECPPLVPPDGRVAGEEQTPRGQGHAQGGPLAAAGELRGTTKGHGVICLRGARLSVGKLRKRSVHKKTPGVPSSARVLSRGPGPRARPGSWRVWRAGKGAERVGRLEEIGALAELQK